MEIMKNIKNSFVALAVMVIIVVAVTVIIPVLTAGQKSDAAPMPPTLDVKVINSSSEPVPVMGTVTVGNLGASPLPVRDVDRPTGLPVIFNESYTVPDGKRLVIEYISMGIEATTQCQLLIAGLK